MKFSTKQVIKNILITSILLIMAAVSNADWVKVSSPVSVNLRNCILVDSEFGWAAGDDGVILKTTDGGISFQVQSNPVDYYINDIFFLNRRLGWIVSNEVLPGGSTIITTTNGGLNWFAENYHDSTRLFRTVYFLDSLNGFLAGYGGVIDKTTDGGQTWNSAVIDTSEFSFFPISKLIFTDPAKGIAVGGYIDVAGVIWQTSDSGYNWTADAFSPEPFYDIYARNSNNILAVGGDFEYGVQISKTDNAGLNWTYYNLGIFGQAYSVDFRTANEVWMATGYGQNWVVSYDTGSTWTILPVTDGATILCVDFSDSLHGIAVGSQGSILRYDPGPSGIINSSATEDIDLISFRTYPNPFNPFAKVELKTYSSGIVSIELFDIAGKKITDVLTDQEVSQGVNVHEFDGSSYSSGVYFLKISFTDDLRGNTLIKSGRIVLVK